MTEKTCQFCQSWVRKEGIWGQCERLAEFVAVNLDADSVPLYSKREFGCQQWRMRVR